MSDIKATNCGGRCDDYGYDDNNMWIWIILIVIFFCFCGGFDNFFGRGGCGSCR